MSGTGDRGMGLEKNNAFCVDNSAGPRACLNTKKDMAKPHMEPEKWARWDIETAYGDAKQGEQGIEVSEDESPRKRARIKEWEQSQTKTCDHNQ